MTSPTMPTRWRGLGGGLALIVVTWVAACNESIVEPESPNRAPVAVGSIPAQSLAIVPITLSLSLSEYFDDPDGDPLTYTASSTDPSVFTASATGSTLSITPVAKGKATLIVIATDPGGLVAAQSTGITVGVNRPPVTVGSIPAQSLAAGASVTVEVSAYFDDPDGDTLTYKATSNNTGVANVDLSGSNAVIAGVAEGMTRVVVMATDPGGLSAQQGFDVAVGGGGAGFRDDFDAPTLPGWDVTQATTEISEGILRVTNSTATAEAAGGVERALPSTLTSWEARAMQGRVQEDAAVRMVFSTAFPFVPRFAVEVGSGKSVDGQETNVRVLFFDAGSGQWIVTGGISSEAVQDSAGVLSELRVSLKGVTMKISVGDTEIVSLDQTGAPPEFLQLTGVGLWVVPFANDERTALFDWIEVTGDVVSSDGAGADRGGPPGG